MPPRAVDLGDTSGFVTHAGAKKKKQAAKQADKAKWANSDDEGGSKEGGEANENAGGAGGSNNGDGGAGGDDGDDIWDTGKKKKGKKGKGGVDEEKEKKKKEEEEEEKKRKEEDENAKREEEDVANGDNPLSWADSVGDANPDDDWTGFTSTAKKGKKGKKGKVSLAILVIRGLVELAKSILRQQNLTPVHFHRHPRHLRLLGRPILHPSEHLMISI